MFDRLCPTFVRPRLLCPSAPDPSVATAVCRQIPVFVSVFFGLRQLTNLPLVSLKDGGMLWFVDLTVADPYYLLPAITSLTMLATIEVR